MRAVLVTEDENPGNLTPPLTPALLPEELEAISSAPVRAELVGGVKVDSFRDDVQRKVAYRRLIDPQGEDEGDGAAAKGKVTQDDAGYRYAADQERSCATCAHFLGDSCELVAGMVRAIDTCDLWEERERELFPVVRAEVVVPGGGLHYPGPGATMAPHGQDGTPRGAGSVVGVSEAFDPGNHPRDEHGRFAGGGGDEFGSWSMSDAREFRGGRDGE